MRVEFSEIGSTAPQVQARVEHATAPPLKFDLPGGVLAALIGAAAAYLLVMGLAFSAGTGIGLIFTVFFATLAAFYGLPAIMARASGGLRKGDFERRGAWGVDTASGYLTGRAALAQILTVPLLMVVWALFVAALV